MAKLKINKEKVLYDGHTNLKQYDFEVQQSDGQWKQQELEVLDHGNAVTILLYNKKTGNVLLTRQFRLASHVNGNEGGMLLEACAGLLDGDEPPAEAVIREVKEETGYVIKDVQQIFSAYSSPGVYAELLHYFVAPYSRDQKEEEGGGLEEEGEDVVVVEIPFSKALQMVQAGEIRDAKTILLLLYAQANRLLDQ